MKVRTLGPVEYDGKKVKVGAVIEVTEAAGDQLIESGSAELVGKAKREVPPSGGSSGGVANDADADEQTADANGDGGDSGGLVEGAAGVDPEGEK